MLKFVRDIFMFNKIYHWADFHGADGVTCELHKGLAKDCINKCVEKVEFNGGRLDTWPRTK